MKRKPRAASSRRPTERRAPDVRLGRVVGRFGVHGELKVEPTRSGSDALRPGLTVRAKTPQTAQELCIRELRRHKSHVLILFEGLEADGLDALVGTDLYGDRESVVLAAGEYFDDDLIGCAVVDAPANEVGRVVGVLHYPGQDMLVVGARRALIPLVGAFIRGIDVAAKRIDVELPEGLLD